MTAHYLVSDSGATGWEQSIYSPGYLIPNDVEALIVNLTCDLYLELRSFKETAAALNHRGYRTKFYASRRGKFHPGTEFRVSSTQYLLRSPAYIGKKAIEDAADESRLVDAVWPGIVATEKFQAVQELMLDNGQTHRNGASSVQHVYSLSKLIYCKRWGFQMTGGPVPGVVVKSISITGAAAKTASSVPPLTKWKALWQTTCNSWSRIPDC